MRPPASRRLALYLIYFKSQDEPVLVADADDIGEAFAWLLCHYGQVRRRADRGGRPAFIEFFDWDTGVTVHWTRVA